MKFTSRLLLSFLSLLVIVSFQNCGQSGSISMQNQSGVAKMDTNNADQPNLPNPVSSSDPALGDPITIVDPDRIVGVSPTPPPTASPAAPPTGSPTMPAPPVASVIPPSAPPPSTVTTPPVMVPPNNTTGSPTVSHGAIKDEDAKDDSIDVAKEYPDYDIDEDSGHIKSGYKISCAGLNRLMMITSGFARKSNVASVSNSTGVLKISSQDQVSINNHRGLLFLFDIKNIIDLNNIKALFLLAEADNITNVNNVMSLSIMRADVVSKINNFRGLLCLDSPSIDEISNYRGILEISGNVKKINNFRGILKVKGHIDHLENFRGTLNVDGDILSQNNVKILMK